MVDFTVAIRTYNGEQNLPILLERLRSQVGTESINWEVVIVDNNSTDGTAKVIEQYQANWPAQFPLNYFFESKQGAAIARQRAIREAQGTFIAFLDDDNYPSENWLAECYAFAIAHPQMGACGSQIEGENLVLVIAGRSRLSKSAEDELKAIADDSHIKLFLKFIPDEDVQLYLKAADLVVLPYLEILNSGSALLALSFNRPILVPNRGAMSELQQQVGSTWVRTYTGELTSTILKESLDWTYNEPRSELAALEDLSWSSLSEKTLAVYQAVSQAEPSQLKEAQ